jgi:flagellar biosynthesis/type III secretory pathway protein FliH
MEHQERRLVRGEIGRAEDSKRAAEDIAELKKHDRRAVKDFGSAMAEKKEWVKKTKEIVRKLALVEQREEDLKTAETRLKHRQARSKTFQDLSEAVAGMGTKVEKASRDMRNASARKSNLQSAVEKWQRQYCEPSIQLVQLNEQLKQEQDKNQEEHALHVKTMQEEEESQRLQMERNEEERVRLAAERQAFVVEKQEWYLQKGRTLSGTGFDLTLDACVEKRIEDITPVLMEEAQRYIWKLQMADWDARKIKIVTNAKEQSHEDGYTQGLAEARRIASADVSEIEGKAYEDGYSVGYEAGKTFGMNWVEMEHKTQLPRIQEETEYTRETTLLSTIQKIDYVADGKVRRIFACCPDMTCSAHGEETVLEHQFSYGNYSRGAEDDADTDRVNEYIRGNADGQAQGYERGRSAGHSQGHQKGYTKGYAVGRSQGQDGVWQEGYSKGYADANADDDGRLTEAY